MILADEKGSGQEKIATPYDDMRIFERKKEDSMMPESKCEKCRWHFTRRYLDAKEIERKEVWCGEKYSPKVGEVTLECDDFWRVEEDK